jgi:pseudaminic acid synthase
MGASAAIAAVALGARIVEKHFILDRSLGGPDAAFSMEPDAFKSMVQSIREVEQALGSVDYRLTDSVVKSRQFARSLFAVADIRKGEVFSRENVRSMRPGNGLHPRHLPEVLGTRAKRDIRRGTPLVEQDL